MHCSLVKRNKIEYKINLLITGYTQIQSFILAIKNARSSHENYKKGLDKTSKMSGGFPNKRGLNY